MDVEKKGIGVNLHSSSYYTDHLGVICVVMNIPLLVTDKDIFNQIEGLYPGLQILSGDFPPPVIDYLAANYDVFFQSDLCSRDYFYSKVRPYEEKYHKIIRNIHCPHGYSDKEYYLKKSALEDITLVYGERMLDLYKTNGVYEQLRAYVKTGNYRYLYYKQHRTYFDEIAEKRIFSQFEKKQPILLYAPTWNDGENTSSYFAAADTILDNLPAEYNLLIKLHPNLEQNDIVQFYRILGKYEKKGNVVFVKDFPLIYPLLARADAYIGDMSSIGYDFLTFNRPLFFLDQEKKTAFLHQCGLKIQPEHYDDIYRIIDKQMRKDDKNLQEIRTSVYNYTFGEEVSFETLRKEIIKAYNGVRQ